MALNFTKRQWLTLFIIGLADFCNAICVSLQSPFFPREAEAKGCTATEYGLVFGVFELVVFFISPFYGRSITKLGPKILFNAGIFTSAASAIMFGLLDHVPGHGSFLTLAFVVRIIEALGNAAFLTASFAIIAKEFPDNVATTFASLETFFGLGLIVGPTLGGALYSVDGYYLPFVVLGSSLFITGILTILILPKHPRQEESQIEKPSLKKVLCIPSVVACSLAISATSASIGFLTAVMEPRLRNFELTPVALGTMFIINGGLYALSAPMWGWLLDKTVNPKASSLMGCILIAIGYSLIGPAAFMPVKDTLTVVIIGLVFHGFGIAAVLVSSFSDALRTSIDKGLPDNIETYGLISGLWTSTFALGAFIGPSISGYLYDAIGFQNSVIVIIAAQVAVAIVLFIFICIERSPRRLYKELDVMDPLITNSNTEIYSNGNGYLGSPLITPKNGTIFFNDTALVDQRPCAINNLLACNNYTNSKERQWSRPDHTPIVSCGTRNYGTVEASPISMAC